MYIYFVEKGNHSYFLKMGSIVNCDNLKYKETNVKNLEKLLRVKLENETIPTSHLGLSGLFGASLRP